MYFVLCDQLSKTKWKKGMNKQRIVTLEKQKLGSVFIFDLQIVANWFSINRIQLKVSAGGEDFHQGTLKNQLKQNHEIFLW